jgi:glycosyltransferase involved in cell wall biosynthesis
MIVDDASTDDTTEVAQQWARDKNLALTIEILAENSGAAAARNRGIALATTRYICFLDSDDEHLPHTLEKLVAALDLTPNAVLSFGDGTIVSPAGTQPSGIFSPKVNMAIASETIGSNDAGIYRLIDAKSVLLKASIIPTSATCFRRDAAMEVGGMPVEYRTGEDWLFLLRMSEKGEFVFYREDMSLYYRHPDNLTHMRSLESTSRQKLISLNSILDGSFAISLTAVQRESIRSQIQHQADGWRYHLSLLGVKKYISGLSSAEIFTGKGLVAHLATDPKSFARSIFKSITLVN